MPKRGTDTHCANGHEYTEETSYWRESPKYKNGKRRICRLCARNWQTKYMGRPPIPDDVPIAKKNGEKTHCKQGHEYTEKNTVVRVNGSRWCRTCQAAVAHRQRLKRYGLTEEQYLVLTALSGEVCQICGESNTKTLHIDHDHKGGVVRGLLCENCNNGLGRFKDDPARLEAAAKYLRAHQAE